MAGDINFDRLEREVAQALEADRRYSEKNDAKFRAVNQRVGSYEEFKEIVNASHLKPLNKGERVADMRGPESGVWNRGVSVSGSNTRFCDPREQSTTDNSSVKATTAASASEPPISCQQFLRHWRSLKTPEAQSAYMLSLAPSIYSTIFAADVPFGLLGQFICAFDACLEPNDAPRAVGILAALARCQRFRLAVEFFSPAEKQAAGRLMERLSELPLPESQAEATDDCDDLTKLRMLYLSTQQ